MKLVLWQERNRRKWSQEFVAKQVGVTASAVGFIETGKRKPSYDVLVKMEDLFGMSHRELFAAVDDDDPNTAYHKNTRTG